MAECVVVNWHEAPDTISHLLGMRQFRSVKPVIGIGGGVGSGKTTLASRMRGTVLSLDDYNHDFSDICEENYDLPDTADLDLAASHIQLLAGGESVDVPQWSHITHKRDGIRIESVSNLLVVEGLHALDMTLRIFYDLAILVVAPACVRRERWRRIEEDGERSWGVDQAMLYFDSVSEPTFGGVEKSYRDCSDVIVDNGGEAQCL